MKKGFKNLFWVIMTFVWILVIFKLSGMTAQASGSASMGVLRKFISDTLNVSYKYQLISYVPDEVAVEKIAQFSHIFFRKLAHAGAYFVLALLVFHVTTILYNHNHYLLSVILTLALCMVFAMFDEWHQVNVPGRSGEFRDVAIDSIGAFLGILRYSINYWFYEMGFRRAQQGEEG